MSTTLEARHRAEEEREAAILETATDLLLEAGYDAMTLDELARRAHVSKATLYGRWSGKPELVLHVLRHHSEQHRADTATDQGSLRADLLALGESLRGDGSRSSKLVLALAQAIRADATLAAAIEEHLTVPARAQSTAILRRAVDRGDLDERVLALPYSVDLLGALSAVTLLLTPDTPLDVEAVVDHVILPVLHQPLPRKKRSR